MSLGHPRTAACRATPCPTPPHTTPRGDMTCRPAENRLLPHTMPPYVGWPHHAATLYATPCRTTHTAPHHHALCHDVTRPIGQPYATHRTALRTVPRHPTPCHAQPPTSLRLWHASISTGKSPPPFYYFYFYIHASSSLQATPPPSPTSLRLRRASTSAGKSVPLIPSLFFCFYMSLGHPRAAARCATLRHAAHRTALPHTTP